MIKASSMAKARRHQLIRKARASNTAEAIRAKRATAKRINQVLATNRRKVIRDSNTLHQEERTAVQEEHTAAQEVKRTAVSWAP